MKVYKNYSLKKYNTFGIEATAASFVDIHSTEELKAVLADNKLPIQLLGGGSNILFTKDYYDCLFIKNSIKGIKIVENTEGSLFEFKTSLRGTKQADLQLNTSNSELNKIINSELNSLNTHLNTTNKALNTTNSNLNKTINNELNSANSELNKTIKNELITIEIGGGELWHDVVLWAISNDLGGIENLSLIPGTIGAAPIQNIGAYGVELKNVFHKLEAFNVQTHDIQTFTAEDCQFGYRESVFKNALKGQYLITKVYLNLTPPQYHQLNLNYGDIQKTLIANNIEKPTIKDISDTVIAIRQLKLPDPKVIGNAGSFFKNPEIPLNQFNELKIKYPLIVGYPTANNTVKVAAGWLIETAGWKGKRMGNIGVHERQALVLVNYGGGKGLEIKALAKKIQKTILDVFGITLTAEVNWL